MKSVNKQNYLQSCQHPAIQALQPVKESTNAVWLPTADELLIILKQKLPYPDRSHLRETPHGWEYDTYFREWADDYGSYIDTHRQFVGQDEETVLLQVLISLLGIDGKWMV